MKLLKDLAKRKSVSIRNFIYNKSLIQYIISLNISQNEHKLKSRTNYISQNEHKLKSHTNYISQNEHKLKSRTNYISQNDHKINNQNSYLLQIYKSKK
jgi:uncharacterized protein (DUF3084 family)